MYSFEITPAYAYTTPTHTPSASDSGSPLYSTYSPSALAQPASIHRLGFSADSSDATAPSYFGQQQKSARPAYTDMTTNNGKAAVEDFDAAGAPPSLAASFSGPYGQLTRPLTHREESLLAQLDRLKFFLSTAPSRWGGSTPDALSPALNRFALPNHEYVSCVLWDGLYHITGTDIVRALVFRFEAFGRPVKNMKKFEEGVFSDLRNLKPGMDACLEEPKSPFLDLLFKYQCIRTQKKQKVFYWFSVPHDRLFLDALDRDLKRERAGQEPTSAVTGEPALSFKYDTKRSLFEQFLPSVRAGDELEAHSDSEQRSPYAHMFSLFEGSPNYKTRGKPKRRAPNALTLIPHGQSSEVQNAQAEQDALGLQMDRLEPAAGALSSTAQLQWSSQQMQAESFDDRALNAAQSDAQLGGQEQPSAPLLSISPALNSVAIADVSTPPGSSIFGAHRPALERRHNSYPVSMSSYVTSASPHMPAHAATLPSFVPGAGAPTSAELAAQAQLQAGAVPRMRGFVCPLYTCGRTFKRMEHLKRHVRTHTLERPFVCQTCDKRFARSDNLTQHLRTHAREGGDLRQASQGASSAHEQAGGESDSESQGEVALSSGYTTYAPAFQVSPLAMSTELGYAEDFSAQQQPTGIEGQDAYLTTEANAINNGFPFVAPTAATDSGNGSWMSASPFGTSPQPVLACLDASRPGTASTSSPQPHAGHLRHLSADSGSLSAPSHRASFDSASLVPPSPRPGTVSPGGPGPMRRYRSTTPSFPRVGAAVAVGQQRRLSDYELAAPRGYHPYAAAYGASDSSIHSSPGSCVTPLDFASAPAAAQAGVVAMPRALTHARSSSSLRGDVGNMLTFPEQAYAAAYGGMDANGLMFSSSGLLANPNMQYSSPPTNMPVSDPTFYTLTVPDM